jgi:hypothetical protein
MAEWGSVETDPRPPAEPAAWLDGTDPAGWADTAGGTDSFPPPLDLVARAADGPQVDPDLLDVVEDPCEQSVDPPDALLADLAVAAGEPEADWSTLHKSEDPAVRALALRWRPEGPPAAT